MPDLLGTDPLQAFAGMFGDPKNRWFAAYLLTSLLLAYGVYRLEARRDPEVAEHGFLGFAFPKEIWTHPSARLDVWFFLVNKLVFGLVLGAFAGVAVLAHDGVTAAAGLIGEGPLLGGHPALAMLATTLVVALALDFGLWLGHAVQHFVPVLWEFHKVHHSTQVLTPLSAGRAHPVDDAVTYALGGLCSGAATGLCRVVFGEALVLGVLQLNIVLFLFFVLGFHLRHSHVWLPYTGWLGRVLVSPAHHQVHHSSAERHWDRNMGFVFAIWDWMAGTLHVPARERERFPLGIGGEEREFDTVWRLYSLPFVKAAARLRGRAPAMARDLGFVEVPDPGPAREAGPEAAAAPAPPAARP